ncbi:hypothetical protein [Limisalsivibrio acetivorans]|uniref:hypothetical protein n=1 Tax=Limisalsivibrio acetivorans TaxID=1304888 RepID=UPI0003B358CA|nr:hypothetical protein [Limisalsivibrio acetivorans]
MDTAKIEKSIKIRKILGNLAVGLALMCMLADILTTRNIFTHVGELMLISLLSFGFAIFMDYQVKRLKRQLKEVTAC